MNTRTGTLLKIAGGLLLILVLHYVLDEPTRLPLIRTAVGQLDLTRSPQTSSEPSDLSSILWRRDPSFWLRDLSFEQWEGEQQYPSLQWWLSKTSADRRVIVKKETKVVWHGRTAVRLECDGATHCGNVRQELPQEVVSGLRGRRLKFSVWIVSLTLGVPCLHIREEEGTYSEACLENLGGGGWQLVSVERLISPDATRIVLSIDTPELVTMTPVYVDAAQLVAVPPSIEASATTVAPAPLLTPPSSSR